MDYFDRKYEKKNGGHPASYLPNGGLRHSLEELTRIYPTFHLKTLAQMAEYADRVTIDCAGDDEFRDMTLMQLMSENIVLANLNTTAIANMAHIVVTIRDENNNLRRLALGIIESFKKYRAGVYAGLSSTLRDKMAAMRANRKSRR